MNERDDDWKQDVLEDFRRWLAGVTEEEAGAADHEPPECDLRDLFAELAALRQEVRLRNREQSRAGRELAKAADLYETVTHPVRRHEEDLAAFEARIARAAEARCLRGVEIRDTLERAEKALDTAPGEDQEGMVDLMEDLRNAVKEGRDRDAAVLRQNLDEILFYLE